MLKCVVFWVTECYCGILVSMEKEIRKQLSAAGIDLSVRKINEMECGLALERGYKKTDQLFITDSSLLFAKLYDNGYYTIALYHEGNREETFQGALYAVEDVQQLAVRSYEEVYRRLAGFPWDILETKRLRVRESTLEDVGEFYRIYAVPSITYYMEDLFKDPQEELAYMEAYIKQVYGFYGFGLWTVILKDENKVIGRAGLSVREGYEAPELGFVIDAAYQKKGYAYEVCRAILDYGKEELCFDEVQALVKEENKASIALLSKLGFHYEKDVMEKNGLFRLYLKRL